MHKTVQKEQNGEKNLFCKKKVFKVIIDETKSFLLYRKRHRNELVSKTSKEVCYEKKTTKETSFVKLCNVGDHSYIT